MGKLTAAALMAMFQKMLSEKWGYIPGSSGQLWTQADQNKKAATDAGVKKYGQQWVGHHVADCSGAFVWAYRQHGLSIYHGSNRIAREYLANVERRTQNLENVECRTQNVELGTTGLLPPSLARPGMAAFKAYKPGDKYYTLPSEYKPGGKHYNGDLNDYYHIGLVDDDPAYVINAATTKSGVIRSKIDGWTAVEYLKDVQYDEGGEEPMGDKYIVTAANGKPVNLRSGPRMNCRRIAEIPVGTEAELLEQVDEEWVKIRCLGKTGYMMRKYLESAGEDSRRECVEKIRALLQQAEALLEELDE